MYKHFVSGANPQRRRQESSEIRSGEERYNETEGKTEKIKMGA